MIRVESNMSFPGPEAMHIWVLLLQVECSTSHGSPVSMHLGPRMLGETSPRLELANAAMKEESPTRDSGSTDFSNIRLAAP